MSVEILSEPCQVINLGLPNSRPDDPKGLMAGPAALFAGRAARPTDRDRDRQDADHGAAAGFWREFGCRGFHQGKDGSGVLVNPLGEEVLVRSNISPLPAGMSLHHYRLTRPFAPIHDMQWRMLAATLLLNLLAGRDLAGIETPVVSAGRYRQSTGAYVIFGPATCLLPVIRKMRSANSLRVLTVFWKSWVSESLLKQVLNTSSVAIFLVDRDGRITQANQRMAEMFGKPVAELLGGEYVSLIHPAEREIGRQKMLNLLASKIPLVELTGCTGVPINPVCGPSDRSALS